LELIFNPIRHHLSHHPCDRQKSYQSHFIGSIARSDLWGIKWLEAYPTGVVRNHSTSDDVLGVFEFDVAAFGTYKAGVFPGRIDATAVGIDSRPILDFAHCF
jgi:hypothetical protein